MTSDLTCYGWASMLISSVVILVSALTVEGKNELNDNVQE